MKTTDFPGGCVLQLSGLLRLPPGYDVSERTYRVWLLPEVITCQVRFLVVFTLDWTLDSFLESWFCTEEGNARIARYWNQGVRMLDQGAGYPTVLWFVKRLARRRRAAQRMAVGEPGRVATFSDRLDADRLLHLTVREATMRILLDTFEAFGEAASWEDLERAGRWPPDDSVHQKLQAIAAVIDEPRLIEGLRSNAALFRRAAETAGLRYENDPADTFARDLRPKFPGRFGIPMPRTIPEWEAFLRRYFHDEARFENGPE